MVEPAPRDTEVFSGRGFECNCSLPAGPLCRRCAPTCLEIKSNLVPHMAALLLSHCNLSVLKQPRDFNL